MEEISLLDLGDTNDSASPGNDHQCLMPSVLHGNTSLQFVPTAIEEPSSDLNFKDVHDDFAIAKDLFDPLAYEFNNNNNRSLSSVSSGTPTLSASPTHIDSMDGDHSVNDLISVSPTNVQHNDNGRSRTSSRDSSDQMVRSFPSSSTSERDGEENFESYGDNENIEYESELCDEDDIPDGPISLAKKSASLDSKGANNRNLIGRNSWMRTSLRRTSPGSNRMDSTVAPRRWGSLRYPNKRFGSHAVASQLYHNNGSFNSSGRSSNCDDGEANSDVSLEEDVNELSQKVQILTDKVGVLTEGQAETDEKYSKVKQENFSLRSKIDELEEEVRELNLVSKEQLEMEQKRSKEMLARLEREKQLEIENYAMRLQSVEKDHANLREEAANLKQVVEKFKLEKRSVEEQLIEAENSLQIVREENNKLNDEVKREKSGREEDLSASKQIIEGLSNELETLKQQLRSQSTSPMVAVNSSGDEDLAVGQSVTLEIEKELRSARESIKHLTAENEDLRCQMLQCAHEKGRELLSPKNGKDISIGDEIHTLSEQEGSIYFGKFGSELEEIRDELKEQKEVNFQLKHYIDSILSNIMERYPELLEVRK